MSDNDPGAGPSAREIRACLRPVCAAAAPMPKVRLLGGERMRLAGYRFEEAEELVDAVVRTLRHNRGLFPDVPTDPQQIADHKERALAYKQLHAGLLMLAERAYDHYLIENAAAVQGAMDVVRQVRADEVRPFAGPGMDARERRDALLHAETILAGRIERQKRAHKRRRAKEAEPPPEPRPRGLRPLPSTVAAREAHKAYRHAVVDGYLEAKRRARRLEQDRAVQDVHVAAADAQPCAAADVQASFFPGEGGADVKQRGPKAGAGRRSLYRKGIIQEE